MTDKNFKLKLTKVKTVPWGYVTAVPPVLMPNCVFDDVKEGAAQSGEVIMFKKNAVKKKMLLRYIEGQLKFCTTRIIRLFSVKSYLRTL